MKIMVTGGSGFVGSRLVAALTADGHHVTGIARSDDSAATIAGSGAAVVRGDLSDEQALADATTGAEVVYHVASLMDPHADPDQAHEVNVAGTRRVLDAARAAGARRVVYVSAGAVDLADPPYLERTEARPLHPDRLGTYGRTKALAELMVRDANGAGLETIAIRPVAVWGTNSPLGEELAERVRSRAFAWFGGGDYPYGTVHVDNVVEALLAAHTAGQPGAAYYVADATPWQFRDFVSSLLAAEGVAIPRLSVPIGLARAGAAVVEGIWRLLGRTGAPFTREDVKMLGPGTVVDERARAELGYTSHVSRAQGLAELRSA